MKLAEARQYIRAEVADIQPFDALERRQIDQALAWIDSGDNIWRVQAPDKPPMHLVSYFVVVDPDHESLLLGDHIKAQLWLPSGGHPEVGELPPETVERESVEELHRKAVFLRGQRTPLFLTITQTVGLTPGHTDVSLWFVLRGDVHDRLDFDRGEYTDMTWFTFQEILASHPAAFQPDLSRFVGKLIAYLRGA